MKSSQFYKQNICLNKLLSVLREEPENIFLKDIVEGKTNSVKEERLKREAQPGSSGSAGTSGKAGVCLRCCTYARDGQC